MRSDATQGNDATGESHTKHPRYRGPVIDAHCHYDASTRARVAGVNRQGGIASAINLWDLGWPPRPFADEQQEWLALAPNLLRCHVPDLSDIGSPGFERRTEALMRNAAVHGAVGIKIWKPLGIWLKDVRGRRVAVNDRRLSCVWAVADELELPVMIHVGDPPAFFAPLTDDNPRIEELRAHPDWWWGGCDYAPLERIHEEFEDLVSSFPSTCFVGVHFGCFMSWTDVDRMLAQYANYHVDTAAAVADLGRESNTEVRNLFTRWWDRILFGTDLIRSSSFDMPETARRWELCEFFQLHWEFFESAAEELFHPLPAQGQWRVHGLDLPVDVLESIYRRNAERLFKFHAIVE